MRLTTKTSNIFPGSCEDYAQHLGPHQAEAFRLLWHLDRSADPIMDADGAAWEIAAQGRTGGPISTPPEPLLGALHLGAHLVHTLYEKQRATALDVEYIQLFPMIAAWQHENLAGALESITNSLAE